ncbi:xanthine dehydrogenase accessory protein XdhC [Rhodovulum tesquicola]|uniref:xanthine dehydrogenase accessory protein XdhC n=1 Tax=Rhodovulum tesquicola TaxID=540254 RepID=UPI0020978EDE|nr:xanthine dehydrogenase accessory protein XdhC [Rhodovulum tesquicola]
MAEASGFLSAHPDAVLVRLEGVQGSAPREAGAWMLVAAGACFGTIGGGRLEFDAIAAARAMLDGGAAEARLQVVLGPDGGQCCGGRVGLVLRRLDPAARAALLRAEEAGQEARPLVLILGAGHVGRALAGLLVQMPVRALLIDSRADQVAQAPPGVEARMTPLPEAEIRAAPPGAAHVVLTHDHGLDFLLVAEALARGDAAYVGMIGSASKRARLLRFLAERGVAHRGLTCPIGAAGAGDKRPAVIAAFVLAEIMAALGARVSQAASSAADG